MNLTTTESPKILIYGTGAIGSILGGKLAMRIRGYCIIINY
jgi:prephenate dehydrogenase